MKAKVRVPTLREEREGWLTQTDEIKNPTPSRRSGQALSRKTRRGWGTRTKAERSYRTMDITWLDEEERIGVGGDVGLADDPLQRRQHGALLGQFLVNRIAVFQ